MGCGHWECSRDYSCGCGSFYTIVSHLKVVECCSASWHEACQIQLHDPRSSNQKGELRYLDSCTFAECPALGDLSALAFCPSHLHCKIKGAAPFSPFSFPNKSSSMLQMVKGWSWGGSVTVVPYIRHIEGEASASIGHGSEGWCSETLSYWKIRVTIPTGSSPDAFQETSCLDLCPLKCSLPYSPVESQWETANWILKTLCSAFENLTIRLSTWQLVKSAKQHQSKSPSLHNFIGLVQLQMDRKLLLNWICLGVQRSRFCQRPIRTRILPFSHLDCNAKGAAPFSPFCSPNKSRATLRMLKGLLWHQVGFGMVSVTQMEGSCTLNQTHWAWGLRFNWPWFWEDYHVAWELGSCKQELWAWMIATGSSQMLHSRTHL